MCYAHGSQRPGPLPHGTRTTRVGPHFRGAPFPGGPISRLSPPRSKIAGFGNTPFPSEMGPLGGSEIPHFLRKWGPLGVRKWGTRGAPWIETHSVTTIVMDKLVTA
jgi:hypothetical protein